MGYEEHGPRYLTVCLDEKPVVLHADVQPPVPVAPGQPERVDFEYERRGTQPLCHGRAAGWLATCGGD